MSSTANASGIEHHLRRIRAKSIRELWTYATARARGTIERRKLDSCGGSLRAVGRIRRPHGAGAVRVGARVLFWPDVKLSVDGASDPAVLTIGDRTSPHEARHSFGSLLAASGINQQLDDGEVDWMRDQHRGYAKERETQWLERKRRDDRGELGEHAAVGGDQPGPWPLVMVEGEQ